MKTQEHKDSVAGAMVGLRNDQIVTFSKETGEKNVVSIKGRWIYIKKAIKEGSVGGIIVTEKSRQDCPFGLILAIGDKCGQFEKISQEKKRLRDWCPSVKLSVKPLDRVWCPDDHEWAIKLSPYGREEFFVHECVVMGAIE